VEFTAGPVILVLIVLFTVIVDPDIVLVALTTWVVVCVSWQKLHAWQTNDEMFDESDDGIVGTVTVIVTQLGHFVLQKAGGVSVNEPATMNRQGKHVRSLQPAGRPVVLVLVVLVVGLAVLVLVFVVGLAVLVLVVVFVVFVLVIVLELVLVLWDVMVTVLVPETDHAIIHNADKNNPIRILRETLLLHANFIMVVDKGKNPITIKEPITINDF
jgi:hypothetical protein